MDVVSAKPGRWGSFIEEMRKIPAFFRRDLLLAWSYRLAFFMDWLNLIVQVALFYFIGRLVDPTKLPSFGGKQVSYFEFAVVGIALASFTQVALGRVTNALRNEQLMGTLEPLLTTPTASATLQLGSVVYDLVYVPIRTMAFLMLTSLWFGVHFSLSGLGSFVLILLPYIPFVWGLGLLSAAGTLTFRQGVGVVGILTTLFTFTSGAYFPVDFLPGWIRPFARYNPITIALTSIREALLGDARLADALPAILLLLPAAAISLAVGVFSFRLALKRERRLGTLGQY